MQRSTRRLAVAAGLVLSASLTIPGAAVAHNGLHLTPVGATPDVRGVAAPNALSPELREYTVAQGSNKLENPTADVPYYGYDGNGTLLPDPKLTAQPTEASKTEPDKNTY